MFNEYLFLTSNFDTHAAKHMHMCRKVGILDDEDIVLALHTEDPLLPEDTLVVYRAKEEKEAEVVNEEAFKQFRPFGNNPDGSATKLLLFPYLVGHPARRFSNGKLYPAGDEPLNVEARHKYFDTPDTPSSTGWGFRLELVGSYETRDPTSRAIYVYPNADYTGTGWTTAALQLGLSEWQTGEEGEPLTVYYTESWEGDRPDNPKDWYIGMLFGSKVEGRETLRANAENMHFLFWEEDQPEPESPEEELIEDWVQPTGAGGPNFPYSVGDVVKHNGTIWVSISNDNVWEPGVYGWAETEESRKKKKDKKDRKFKR